MAAEVLSCGHAHHLMEVDYMDGTPQVHLHFLTEDKEFEETGYGRVELCCHGCGASVLVLYTDEEVKAKHLKIRNQFQTDHRFCPNRTYETSCPDYRRTSRLMDLRLASRDGPTRQAFL